MIASDSTNIMQASQEMLEQYYMSIADMQTQASPEELSGTYLYADNAVVAFIPDMRRSIKRNCANCGAPLYGIKECSYCGTYN